MKNLLIPALILAAALVGGGIWYNSQSSTPAVAPVSEGSAHAANAVHELDFPLGNPDAPVVMIEYSSLTCPHCASFNQGPFRQIKENFVETGQVFYIKREVFFDRFGLWAAMVARCGGEERYHGMLELIYQTQSDWAGTTDPAEVANRLRRLGRQGGMSDAQVNACLEDADKALTLTEFYQANAEAHGIRATPSFIINGEPFSNMSFAEFERVLNEKLGS